MRFEHILQIYWTKGFFYGGKLFYFDKTIRELFEHAPGLGNHAKQILSNRFEMSFFSKYHPQELLSNYEQLRHARINRPINIMFSQWNSVNNTLSELQRLTIIRLYLVKTYRGRCHALGKPVRGQRSWSNAWASYNTNTTLRLFISETRRILNQKKRAEKINYKVVKKKYTSKKKKKTLATKTKSWF